MDSQSEVKGITSELLWATLAKRATFDAVPEIVELHERFNGWIESDLEKGERVAELETQIEFLGKGLQWSEELEQKAKAERDKQRVDMTDDIEMLHGTQVSLRRNYKELRNEYHAEIETHKQTMKHLEEIKAERDKAREVCRALLALKVGNILQATTPCVLVGQEDWAELVAKAALDD